MLVPEALMRATYKDFSLTDEVLTDVERVDEIGYALVLPLIRGPIVEAAPESARALAALAALVESSEVDRSETMACLHSAMKTVTDRDTLALAAQAIAPLASHFSRETRKTLSTMTSS